jgi:2-polyprenyl-3-methyl-5-hydroxy-6-metoxy-1,4-benzoquinol methylase
MQDPLTGQPAEFLFTAKDNRGVPGAFDYYRGPTGHVFIGEVPKNLSDHYTGGYQPIPENEAELAEMAKGEAYRLRRIRELVPSGSFLEIGPWIGLVAYSALKAGYQVSVLERDPRCVDLLNSVGINATRTEDPAKTLAASDSRYDVIGLWHSIEHIPRPWEMVEAAAQALNPGGILVIAAPNPESAQMRVLGKHWLHLDAPRHIHFLPMKVVEELGGKHGLTVVERTTDDPLGQILDEAGWRHEATRKYPLRRFHHRVQLWKWLAKRNRKTALDGAGYTIIMKKPVES